MSDLKDRLSALLSFEPDAPDDLDGIVARGRRARRRRVAVTTVAGGAGAAALTASVVVPISFAHGSGSGTTPVHTAHGGHSPSSVQAKRCEVISRGTAEHSAANVSNPRAVSRIKKLYVLPSPGPGATLGVRRLKHHLVEIYLCGGAGDATPTPSTPPQSQKSHQPRYTYTESPQHISTRLGAELTNRVKAFGYPITYTRPFSQESSTLAAGHPDYFGGNVDVQESHGYGDIGVQVTHRSTHQPALTGSCTGSCHQRTLPNGSVVRTGRVHAGKGNLILTAEEARPDGVLVQAQESNYAFGPQAASEPSGTEPLTLHQLVNLAIDPSFTF